MLPGVESIALPPGSIPSGLVNPPVGSWYRVVRLAPKVEGFGEVLEGGRQEAGGPPKGRMFLCKGTGC